MASFDASKYLLSLNGKALDPLRPQVSIFDRGFLFGDSVYEVIGSYEGILFTLSAHLERLYQSCELLRIRPSQSLEQVRNWALELFDKLGQQRVYLRIIVTRGEGAPDISLVPNAPTNVFMMIRENAPYPAQWYSEGLKLVCPPLHRNPLTALDPKAKSGNYLNNIMALALATDSGAHEACLLNKEGELTEAPTANLWFVKNGRVFTPSLDTGILRGITRHLLLEIGQRYKIPMEQGRYSLQELHQADEIFLSSSTKELVPIVQLDGQKVGSGKPGPFYQTLHRHYHELIGEHVKNAKKLGHRYT